MKNESKTCSKCKTTKSISEFYTVKRKRKNKSGMKEYEVEREKCKDCCKNYQQSRRDLRYYLPRLYNITEEDYENLREKQDFKCAICGITEDEWWSSTQKRLFVDHCHTTNKVRGLLCGLCNSGLGNFKDNVSSLHKAVEYLNETISRH